MAIATVKEAKRTRWVAERGCELIKRPHMDSLGNEVITIKQANGLVHEVPYSDKDIATPVLIKAMLEDKGIPSRKVNEAAEKYCLDYIKGWNKLVVDPEIDGMTVGELSELVEGFDAGWKAARREARA